MKSSKEIVRQLKARTYNPYKDISKYEVVPAERRLPSPDPNHTFTHLYKHVKVCIKYESQNKKVPLGLKRKVETLIKSLNKEGYRVASFPFTVPFTYGMVSFVRVTISAIGTDIGKLKYVDHRMTSQEIKDTRNDIKQIQDRVHGTDPIDDKPKRSSLILPDKPKLIY